MWPSASSLHRGLHEEHFGEACFLHGQIDVMRADEERAFTDVAPFESRLVAHLDGLLVGGSAAQQVIDATFDPAERGSWYVAAILSCMRADAAAFQQVLRSAQDMAAAEAALPLGDALRHRLPSAWATLALSWLEGLTEPWLGAVAQAMALHGLPCQDALTRVLPRIASPTIPLISALGYAGCIAAAGSLTEVATRGPSAAHRQAALLALAHLGDPQAPGLASSRLDDSEASHLALALMSGRSAAEALLQTLRGAAVLPATLRALGLLGDLRAVRPLLQLLEQPPLAADAAWALDCITGANLRTPKFDGADEAEEEGEPSPADGRRLGVAGSRGGIGDAVKRMGRERQVLETDRKTWESWLAEARTRFDATLRYRFGEPCSSAHLVASLGDPARSPVYRQLAAHELAIRHVPPMALDLRATVGRQRNTLARLADWARGGSDRADSGRWLYGARPC